MSNITRFSVAPSFKLRLATSSWTDHTCGLSCFTVQMLQDLLSKSSKNLRITLKLKKGKKDEETNIVAILSLCSLPLKGWAPEITQKGGLAKLPSSPKNSIRDP